MEAIYAHIVGWGMCVPEQVMTNEDLIKKKKVDTSDEWIRTRTGIHERRMASEKESTATLAINAAREALDRARIHPSDVDLVIVASVSPEYILPATASLVQDALGAKNAGAFDLNAGCTGFVYGISLASGMIRSDQAKIAVVIGAETMTRLVDWEDRSTCVLFGDGAGAVVLQASEDPGGVLATVLGSDGGGGKNLIIPAGGSHMPTTVKTVADRQHAIKMKGPEVFKFATRVMGKAAKEACARGGVDLDDVDLLIPHQANARIIELAAKSLKLPPEKVYKNLHKYGNTSGASIPIALCEAIAEGRVKNNDTLVFVGFGSGLTWGATVIKWGLPVPYQQRQKWYRALRWGYYRWAGLRSRIGWVARTLEGWLAHRQPLLVVDSEPTREKEVKKDAMPSSEPAAPPELKKSGRIDGNGNGNGSHGNGNVLKTELELELPAPEQPETSEQVN